MNRKSILFKKITFVLLLLLIGIHVLYAQTPVSESPTAGNRQEWSADSQIYAYRNPDKDLPRTNSTNSQVFLQYPYWETFNPATGDWFETTVWPLYPNLSEAEKAVFKSDGFIRTSPDGEILVYPSATQKLTIANRTTQQIFETDIDYPSDNVLPNWWTEDGQGVAVEGSGNSPYVFDPIDYYLRLRDRQDLTKTDIYLVRWTQKLPAGGRLFTPVETERIFDVHDNQVLTTMSDVTNWGKSELGTDEAQSYLVIWNPENPEASVIIDAFSGLSVRAAAFVPNDPQRLLVILDNNDVGGRFAVQEGLHVYDLQTQGLEYLANFDGYYVNSSHFSPDGNWIAVKISGVNQYAFFRTDDLLALSPLGVPTAFPTFTPVPTYTPTLPPDAP
jgi:WD40 repeat protein